MKKGVPILVLFLLLGGEILQAQERGPEISGAYREVPFEAFILDVEEQTGTRFYYRNAWVEGIEVTLSAGSHRLYEVLATILGPRDLNYYADDQGNIYITPLSGLVTSLPNYDSRGVTGREGVEETTQEQITVAEQRYIEGRKTGLSESLVVGSSEGGRGATSAVIHGKMTDAETGEPLIGATVYFNELKKGAATDVDGQFTIVVRPGKFNVEFDCMGMEERNIQLDVRSGGDLAITMEKALIPITEVVIRANRYHNVRGTQMGFERLNHNVLKEVPVVMGEKDILKVVQMLPGVQSVGEGATGFNVRGSAADQNMIYIQKVPVYNSSHLFGFFTSISPDMVQDFTLYKSNLPASYGGRLASVFDITAQQGNMNRYTAHGGISPVTAQLSVEGPILREKASFLLTARSTYSDWILGLIEDPLFRESEAAFHDLGASLTWEPGEKTRVKAFGYFSKDRFHLGTDHKYDYINGGGSVNLRHRFSERMTGDLALVYGTYDFNTEDLSVASEAYTHRYQIDHYELKGDMSWLSLGKHRLTFGANAIFYLLERGVVEPVGEVSLRNPVDLGRENGIESALYLADEIVLLPQLTLYGGLRFVTFMSLGPQDVMVYRKGESMRPEHVTDTLSFSAGELIRTYTSLEPRLALNYMLGNNNSVKLSYNRVRQFLFMLTNTIAISPTDQWKLCDYHIRPPYVDQISLGYYHDFPRGSISASLETYYKWVHDVVEYRDGASFITSPYVERSTLQGKQEAYGIEAMVRKTGGKLNGWLAYSYSRSYMQVDSPDPGDQINNGEPYPSNYDRPHNLNLVTNYRVNRRLSLSANVVYITGRPVTYPISIYYMEGMQLIDFAARNSYRIPDYFRVDFSINLEGNLKEKKLFHSYWMVNFYNLTGRKNAYSVYFQNEEGEIHGYKLSIFARPIITLSWNFKLGNYASE